MRRGNAWSRHPARRRARLHRPWISYSLDVERRGAVLLEVIVALTIVAISGVSMVALASESLRAVASAHAAEAEVERASGLLDAVALWPRADLDRHLGTRPEGAWLLRVDRPLTTLYVVTLFDSTGARQLVHTALYRPEDVHATS